ncbi:DUF7931 domain-containing protein [Pseudomonas sp. N040]|uniref:DUF7931 domain-containing protein n=1 Tax=Pseudomonas sp. N040 TaxID=2785325 RepID=UPI0018A2FB07|nr:histone acetyltransferase HPA2 [Pseudomonas sp. N040]MBF7731496.1 histone acetyltransferase HPA2 [Pseudomonas sp. N040]MBW7015140.1 histone acetyltransferase HPA2 [Pseudomonas sp. N040]
MNADTPAPEDQPDNLLAPIEFESPGRFTVLNPPAAEVRPDTWQPAPCQLGETAELQRFDNPDGARAQALALLLQARRSLCLYTPDLESWLYNHAVVQDACRAFLLGKPHNRLRILLRDSSKAVRNGHRLLTLARRLSSNLQIRKLHPDYPAEAIAFVVADDRGLLLRPEPDQYAGYALYNDPGRARLRQAQFDQAWDCSTLDPDLRSFLL